MSQPGEFGLRASDVPIARAVERLRCARRACAEMSFVVLAAECAAIGRDNLRTLGLADPERPRGARSWWER